MVGLRVASEHEDECCATVELSTDESRAKAEEIEAGLLRACKAGGAVSKGSRPDHVRIAPLPRNFKGSVQLPDLKQLWTALLKG